MKRKKLHNFVVVLKWVYVVIKNFALGLHPMAEGVGSSFVPLLSVLYIFLAITGCMRRKAPYLLANANSLRMKILVSTLLAPLVTIIILVAKGIPINALLLGLEGPTKDMPTIIFAAPLFWALMPVIFWFLIDWFDREEINQD